MKDKRNRIIVDVILIILGIIFLVFGIRDAIDYYNSSKTEDALLFKKDYSYVSKDNVYKYVTLKEADKLLTSGTGILLIGNPGDSWTQVLVSPLNDIVSNNDMEIYYLEINSKTDTTSKYYKSILSTIGKDSFETPNIILVKEGTILKHYEKADIYNIDELDIPLEYWTSEKLNIFNKELDTMLKNLK